MWQQKINVAPAKISLSAFSLIEVLMASALGAFLLLLVASSLCRFLLHTNQTKRTALLASRSSPVTKLLPTAFSTHWLSRLSQNRQ